MEEDGWLSLTDVDVADRRVAERDPPAAMRILGADAHACGA